MSTSRRIPIAGQRAAPQRPQPSHFQSSLDVSPLPFRDRAAVTVEGALTLCARSSTSLSHLATSSSLVINKQLVFSFSRSQAFFVCSCLILLH